jgi:hypothetical protein
MKTFFNFENETFKIFHLKNFGNKTSLNSLSSCYTFVI